MRPLRRPSGRPTRSPAFSVVSAGLNTSRVAPVLANPTDTKTGATTATLTVFTDQRGGTLYAVVTTSDTAPTAAQVKAGQDHAGAAATFAGSQTITSTGTKTVSATGLTTATQYYAHFMHENADGYQSLVVSGDGFLTD